MVFRSFVLVDGMIYGTNDNNENGYASDACGAIRLIMNNEWIFALSMLCTVRSYAFVC